MQKKDLHGKFEGKSKEKRSQDRLVNLPVGTPFLPEKFLHNPEYMSVKYVDKSNITDDKL